MPGQGRSDAPAEARALYQVAMLVFVVTVSIGVSNGLKVITFTRDQLLTHVHAGTLGWISLGAFATGIWLFAGIGTSPSRQLARIAAWIAAIGIPVYVAAFWSGNLAARAVFGFPVLLAILIFYVWLIQQVRASGWTLPRLAVLLAVTSLVLGSAIGVVIQVQLATSTKLLPDAAIGGHVSAQVVGYLVLIAMAITEWRLKPDAPMTKLGIAQVGVPFVGALIAVVGATIGSNESFVAAILCEIVGIAIYVWRFVPELLRTRWLAADPRRHFALSAIFLPVDLILLVILIAGVVSGTYADFTLIPVWLIFAFDHAMFIGVMSNSLFGLVQVATAERRSLWSWADHLLFWGMNFGMLGFVASLITNQRDLERIFTPIMGVSILVAILAYSLRLRAPRAPVAVATAAE